jgi:hypothetical protein
MNPPGFHHRDKATDGLELLGKLGEWTPETLSLMALTSAVLYVGDQLHETDCDLARLTDGLGSVLPNLER